MTIQTWNSTVIDGKDFLVIDVAKLRIPLEWDPSSNVFLAVSAPDGALLNYPALVRGDDGDTPDIDNVIDFTPIDPDDATPDFASWTETSPNVYKLSLGLHTGRTGDDGGNVLDPTDYGTPVAGKMLVVSPGLTSFGYITPKVGGRYLPASMAVVPSGNPAYTVCAIPIAAQDFDYYPEVEGQCVITGTGADVRVDYLARLSTAGVINGETAGPIIARGFGATGVNSAGFSTVLSSVPPAGSSSTYDKVLAGNTAIVYVRTERQAGANTYTTTADQTLAKVRVAPIP